jgi:hypothetical protein
MRKNRTCNVSLIGQPTERIIKVKFHPQIAGIEISGEIFPWRVVTYQYGFKARKQVENG